MPITRSQSVAQHEGGDAVTVQPLGGIFAFVADSEAAVAPAGADDDGRARRLVGRGQVNRPSGFVALLGADGAGGAFGPEKLDLRLLGGTQTQSQREQGEA